MPWWSWILLWIALIALSLLLHVALGYRLYRNLMSTLRELAEAGSKFSSLPPARMASDVEKPEALEGQGGLEVRPEPGSAIFASPEQMRHDYVTAKAARQEVRRRKRIQRKAERGQPQSLHDIEFS